MHSTVLLLLFSNSFSFSATFAFVVFFSSAFMYFQQSVPRRRGEKNRKDETAGRLEKELKRLQFLTVGSACRMEGVILKNFTRTPIN